MSSKAKNDAGPSVGAALARLDEAGLKLAISNFVDWNTWQKVGMRYRARPDGGPTIHIPESAEAGKILITAGFRYVPEENGFRA